MEGAANEDGRTPSIWDTYTHSAGMCTDSQLHFFFPSLFPRMMSCVKVTSLPIIMDGPKLNLQYFNTSPYFWV